MTNFDVQKSKNPMAEYLLKLQLIVTNTEFKNKSEAYKYETGEYKTAGEAYCRAMTRKDSFNAYQYDPTTLYAKLIEYGCDDATATRYVHDHTLIPGHLQTIIMDQKREEFVSNYKEPNPYYVMLSGKPFQGSDKYPVENPVSIPYEFFKAYASEGVLYEGMPIHLMPTKYQDLFMNTEYYQKTLEENPDHRYLKYIGSNAIPIEVSRPARDGDIMKINTRHLSTTHPIFGSVTVEPDLIHLFVNVYGETQRYVYDTLRGDFSDIYPNYDSFIHFLTIYMAIGSCLNELMRKSASMIYMNDATANDFFMLYGLPSVIMNGPGMISFLKQFRLILQDKGTNVVYRVKDLIGYQYTDIYTLVMVKQQHFENGLPVYDDEGNPKQDIVFRRLGTTDDNTSYFKYRDSDVTYSLDEITSGDPRWWNTPEVEDMLQNMNYTLSNSKYIQLSTHLSMTDIYWQCLILIRGLLDNRFETQFIDLNLNVNLNGNSSLSVFEAVVILEILMNWQLNTVRKNDPHFHGDLYIPNGTYNGVDACLDLLFNGLKQDGSPEDLKLGIPFKISSFNFDIKHDSPEFYQSIQYMDYLEPDVFLPLLDSVLEREDNNIGEIMMSNARRVYDYLVDKLLKTETIQEFRQVTDTFNHLFLVDPIRRKWFDNELVDPKTFICEQYGISPYTNDWEQFLNVFPPSTPQFSVDGSNIYLYEILNEDTSFLTIGDKEKAFMDATFFAEFSTALDEYYNNELKTSPLYRQIPLSIRSYVPDIIKTKITLETSNTDYGPTSLEALLYRTDQSMYQFINSIRNNGENILLVMRSIIKALEVYVQDELHGLEYTAFGKQHYFDILKEVITYFKSYMVEFTKDEFVLIFDGFFDQGGNSNMLRLYDELTRANIHMIVKDSVTLHDASHALVTEHYAETGLQAMHDEMLVHYRVAYKKIKQIGYPILFDDGKSIVETAPRTIDDEEKLVFSIYENPRALNPNLRKQIIIVL